MFVLFVIKVMGMARITHHAVIARRTNEMSATKQSKSREFKRQIKPVS